VIYDNLATVSWTSS